MTGYIDRRSLISFYRFEEKMAQKRLSGLLRIMALLLSVILLANAFLAVTHSLKICYSVTETGVTVQNGDSLWSIGNCYRGEYPGTPNGYIAEICRINQIANANVITTGDILQIPIYDYRFD